MGISKGGVKGFQTVSEEDKRNKRITFYLTDKERKAFIEYCIKNDITSSSCLRDYVNSLSID
jgi:hypothetical protein|tara:strand:- start:1650 stop:1835 length:186 start_codon:yes stop_codon:yes gene_type:complete